MPLHRFIVKPAFQFEIQFNSMARAIIYVDSTLIVYCFRPAPLYVCVCAFFLRLPPSSFILLPKDFTISVKLAIVTRPAKKELLFPPAAGFTFSLFSLLCSTLFCKYYFFTHIGCLYTSPCDIEIQRKLVWL